MGKMGTGEREPIGQGRSWYGRDSGSMGGR